MNFTLDWKEYAKVCRQVAADGAVLLKNDNNVLPFVKNERVAIFGRTQFDYITTGTGSGGMVHVPYKVNLYDAAANCKDIVLDKEVSDAYKKFTEDVPYDNGVGWAATPASQPEFLPEESFVETAAGRNDVAVAIIGRIAGEDKDCLPVEGNYYLNKTELSLLKLLRKSFDKLVVVINACNIIDHEWVDEINPDGLLDVWQGGAESGNAVMDVLTGAVNPSGRLADTIAHSIDDYPSTKYFGDPSVSYYVEDIYVGYRYFETFAKEKVRYPFGYGLSYTDFSSEFKCGFDGEKVEVRATITNTGKVSGRHSVQVYYKAPFGKLGKASRELIRFIKSKELAAGESEELTVSFDLKEMASYDDTNATGYQDCFVLEEGEYCIYTGDDVRSAQLIGSVSLSSTVCLEKTSHALYPKKAFDRFVAVMDSDKCEVKLEPVALRKSGPVEHIKACREGLKEIPYKGDLGIKLKDVYDGKASMEDFVSQLTDEDMIIMTRGEGMCSVRVTPGVAAAFSGMSDRLQSMGIPALACSDGPSGIRMDCGTNAMQSPSGNAVSCTYDLELTKKLYEFVGFELREHEIDFLLGPGMNLRRNPLNGRNFEYFSEDPYLTGAMAVAELKGLSKANETGVIKHFFGNNQEKGRHTVDSIISARAMRELYLKGFEMAVKEGGAYAIMTTYGSVNGTYTGSNFDLNTMILRDDWKFEGITMTDWWARLNDEDGDAQIQNTAFMIRAQNDVYMVSSNSEHNGNGDNSGAELGKTFTRAELQRNVINILKVSMKTNAFERINGIKDEVDVKNFPSVAPLKATANFELEINSKEEEADSSALDLSKNAVNLFHIHVNRPGVYTINFEFTADDSQTSLAQLPVSILVNEKVAGMYSINGDQRQWQKAEAKIDCLFLMDNYIKVCFAQGGLKVRHVKFTLTEPGPVWE